MNATSLVKDALGQRFGVGASQFGDGAVFQDFLDDFMFAGQGLQDGFVGGVLTGFLGLSTSLSLPKRISPSCFGEAMLKVSPAML